MRSTRRVSVDIDAESYIELEELLINLKLESFADVIERAVHCYWRKSVPAHESWCLVRDTNENCDCGLADRWVKVGEK